MNGCLPTLGMTIGFIQPRSLMDDEDSQPFLPLQYEKFSKDIMKEKASSFFSLMDNRRTTRHFTEEPVEKELIEFAIKTASTTLRCSSPTMDICCHK